MVRTGTSPSLLALRNVARQQESRVVNVNDRDDMVDRGCGLDELRQAYGVAVALPIGELSHSESTNRLRFA
jgi:hypothetical protein